MQDDAVVEKQHDGDEKVGHKNAQQAQQLGEQLQQQLPEKGRSLDRQIPQAQLADSDANKMAAVQVGVPQRTAFLFGQAVKQCLCVCGCMQMAAMLTTGCH